MLLTVLSEVCWSGTIWMEVHVNSARGRNTLVLLILLLIFAVLIIQFRAGSPQPERLYFNQVAEAVKKGEVTRVVVDDNNIGGIYRDGHSDLTPKEPSESGVNQMKDPGGIQ